MDGMLAGAAGDLQHMAGYRQHVAQDRQDRVTVAGSGGSLSAGVVFHCLAMGSPPRFGKSDLRPKGASAGRKAGGLGGCLCFRSGRRAGAACSGAATPAVW
ncbi:hypothetical protein GCM10017612_47360 [Novosphingobium resinovorum]|nr:hypothetical protein GCM10017612_47360 [Novosphingobium resinovorum]